MNRSTENTAVLYDPATGRWLHFHRPRQVLVARTAAEVLEVLAEVERRTWGEGLWAAGFVAYEAAPAMDAALVVRPADDFPLAWFGLYSEPDFVQPPPPADTAELAWTPSISDDDYRRAIGRIRQYIRAGDTYQVNYSFRLRAAFSGEAWPLFCRMVAAQGSGQAAFVDAGDWAVASASPELFFRLDGRTICSRPMKGTAARGLWPADDLRQAAWLRASEKNRAENVMIVDMARNDVGRVADPGSVAVERLFDVEKYPSLWQMTSTVRARCGAGLPELFGAMFPAASITGAPKARTMAIIAELETAPRRIYTGAIGFVGPGRRAQFNVAIRTVLVDRRSGMAEYGVGGGIVWDSEAGAELLECRTKARVLTQTRPEFDLLETLRWTPGEGYFLLDRHLERLAESAAYFQRPLDLPAVRQSLVQAAARFADRPQRVRLTVSADGRPRVESKALAPTAAPYRVRLAAQRVDPSDVFLYHKTTHRAVYEQALASAPGCDDALLVNQAGELTESTIANLALELDGRLLTPPLHSGLLPGVLRAQLLAEGRIAEQVLLVTDLARASKIFLLNSVRGLWQVELGGQP